MTHSRFARPLHWAPLLTLISAGFPLEAQQPKAGDSTSRGATGQRLPAVVVTTSVLTGAGPEVKSAVPARASVISSQEIGAWQPRLLSDALAGQSGVSLYDDLGSPYKPTLVTRGFTAGPVVGLPQGVSVFVDGVPVNEPDAGQVNFDLLPLAHVSRVEILSGTAALLGPNSLGGAVNLVTRHGAGAPTGAVELALGSHDRYSIEATTSSQRGRWGYYVGAGDDWERGWRQLTSARLTNVFLNVDRFGERSGIGVQAFGARSRAETAGSLPLSVYDVRPDSNLSAGDFEDLDQLHLAVTGYTGLAGGRASVELFARRHGAERLNVNQEDDPAVRAFSKNQTLGLTMDWRRSRPVGPGLLGARLGGGGQINRTHVRLFTERIDPGLTTDVESPIRKADGFALLDYQLGPVTVSGGSRYDIVRVPSRNRLNPAGDTTSTFHRASSSVGVRLALTRDASLYASLGQSFRAPAVIELACADPNEPCPLPFALGDDPPLAPVVATTYEMGGQFTRGAVLVDASAYLTNVRDDIFLVPYEGSAAPEGSTIDGYFANVARTRRAGIELGSRVFLPGGHTAHATYGLTRATFESSAEIFSVRELSGGQNSVVAGDRMPMVPRQTAAIGADFRLPVAMQLGIDARYTGERWLRGDEANQTPPLPGHWVTDVRLGYELRAWRIEAVLRNATDRRYATFGTFNVNRGGGGAVERFVTPAEPRTVRFVVRRSFGPQILD